MIGYRITIPVKAYQNVIDGITIEEKEGEDEEGE